MVTQTRENFVCVLAWEGSCENGSCYQFPANPKFIFHLLIHHMP